MTITQSDVRDMASHFFPHLTEAIGIALVNRLLELRFGPPEILSGQN